MKSVHSSPSLLALLLATVLAGCTAVGPEHHVPDVATGDGWISGTSAPVDSDTLTQWWTTFHDADLDRLVEQALAHNLDLRQADLAVAAARALQANGLPPAAAAKQAAAGTPFRKGEMYKQLIQ